MKAYMKTMWIDGETPINSANLNKIEKGISDISVSALTASDVIEGKGIKIEPTPKGLVISEEPVTIDGVELVGEMTLDQLGIQPKGDYLTQGVADTRNVLVGGDAESTDYDEQVNALIRERYSLSNELALLRQRESKPAEFEAYNTYCEECKSMVKNNIRPL